MRRREVIAGIGRRRLRGRSPLALSSLTCASSDFWSGRFPAGYAILLQALRLGLRDTRIYRRAKHRDRVSVGRSKVRPPSRACRGTGRSQGRRHHNPWHACIPCGEAGDGGDFDRHGDCRQSPSTPEFAAGLARPGGNITGSSFFDAELNAKRLEFMKVTLPELGRIAVLVNPDNPQMLPVLRVMRETARAIEIDLQTVTARRLDDLDAAVELAAAQAEALAVHDDGLFIANAQRIAEQAIRKRLPSIGFRVYCEAGGLVGYGVDFPGIWRRSMVLVRKNSQGCETCGSAPSSKRRASS